MVTVEILDNSTVQSERNQLKWHSTNFTNEAED